MPTSDGSLYVCRIPAEALREWRRLAAALEAHGPAPCEKGDAERWWPAGGRTPPDPLAVQSCAECAARVECLAYALAAGERQGVWGGLTAAERSHRRPA